MIKEWGQVHQTTYFNQKMVKESQFESGMGDMGFVWWDNPKEFTVSPFNLSIDCQVIVFGNGDTHNDFNTSKTLYHILLLSMAGGWKDGVITGVRIMEIKYLDNCRNQFGIGKKSTCEKPYSIVLSLESLYMINQWILPRMKMDCILGCTM